MAGFDDFAAQAAACATRWDDARARYTSATEDWARALTDFADHIAASESADPELRGLLPALRGFVSILEGQTALGRDELLHADANAKALFRLVERAA